MAEYQTKANTVNQIVIWDRIIERGSGLEVIDEPVVHTKYDFIDDGTGLHKNDNVTLALHWNVIPNAGLLPRFKLDPTRFAFGDYFM